MTTPPASPTRPSWIPNGVAALIALASASCTLWQNLHLTVLWDLSYILENASRMASGDMPYRDFPFPYAPLTFLLQAAIIRLTGPVIWHHTLYAVLGSALGTLLTWRIARRLTTTIAALALTSILAFLGVYCIVPNPFYDPDSCILLLILLGLLLTFERGGWTRLRPLLIGVLCVVPIFVKQNIGLAFLCAVVATFALVMIAERNWRVAWLFGGVGIGVVVAVLLVAAIPGAGNYYRWTIAFAASRRLPPLRAQLAIYDDPTLWWWLLAVAAGAVLIAAGRRFPLRQKFLRIAGALCVALPPLWCEVRYFLTEDPDEVQINLLRFWPLALCAMAFLSILAWRRERGAMRVLPLLLIGIVHGTFMSQSTWGSTYGIWPLLVLMLALLFRFSGTPSWVACVFAIAILHAGVDYIGREERLTYAKVLSGPIRHSTLPALRGLAMRGEWLPEFEELVRYTDRTIPRQDAILSLPGEDLFYFSTGRRPRFPVLMFDRTVNPYDAVTLVRLARERNVKWLILKKRLQLNGVPMQNLDDTMTLLRPNLSSPVLLANYEIYRLRW